MLLRFVACLCALLLFGLSPAAQAAPEASEFREAIEAFDSGDRTAEEWLSQESPFAFALGQQFDEALTDNERTRMNVAVRHGQCEIVVSEQLRGFLRSYPNLARAIFKNGAFQTLFAQKVLPQHSHAYRHCTAWAALIPVLEEAKRRNVFDDYFLFDFPMVAFGKWQSELEDNRLTHAMLPLLRLAMCDSYLPALEDISDIAQRPDLTILLLPELHWLEFKLAKAGKETATLMKLIEERRSETGSTRLLRDADYLLRQIETQGADAAPPPELLRFCSR